MLRVYGLLLAAIFLPRDSFALPTAFVAGIQRSQLSEEQIGALQFDSLASLPVYVSDEDEEIFVDLIGSVQTPFTYLRVNHAPIQIFKYPEGQTKFRLTVHIESPEEKLVFNVIDSNGHHQTETILVEFPDWEKWLDEKSKIARSRRPTRINFSLGTSFLSYQETAIGSFTEIGLTGKAGMDIPLSPRWNLNLGGYGTILPLTSTDPNRSIRFYGINLRFGYRLNWLPKPWSLSFDWGAYYAGTISSPAFSFGFASILGPQLFPVVTRAITPKDVLSLYLKYSLLSSGFVFNTGNYEIASGFAYNYLLKNRNTLVLSIDCAQLSLNIQNLLWMTSRSASFSVGYKW